MTPVSGTIPKGLGSCHENLRESSRLVYGDRGGLVFINLYVVDECGYDLILWWKNSEACYQGAVVYEHYTWEGKNIWIEASGGGTFIFHFFLDHLYYIICGRFKLTNDVY